MESNTMNRRGFVGRWAGFIAATSLPIPAPIRRRATAKIAALTDAEMTEVLVRAILSEQLHAWSVERGHLVPRR